MDFGSSCVRFPARASMPGEACVTARPGTPANAVMESSTHVPSAPVSLSNAAVAYGSTAAVRRSSLHLMVPRSATSSVEASMRTLRTCPRTRCRREVQGVSGRAWRPSSSGTTGRVIGGMCWPRHPLRWLSCVTTIDSMSRFGYYRWSADFERGLGVCAMR